MKVSAPFIAAGTEGVALRDGARELTFTALRAWSDSLAAAVLGWGPATERTVGILAPPGQEFVAALTALWRAGAIAVPLQPQHPKAELEYLLTDARLEDVFVHETCWPLAQALGAGVRFRAHRMAPGQPALAAPSPPSPEAGALIIYTSGTTSRPKGVVSTYGSLTAQISSLHEAWRWAPVDRTLNVLPLHHVHGLVNVLACSLAVGARCELVDKFRPELVWDRFAELTVFMAVPTIYAKLLAHWEQAEPEARARWSAAAARLRLMVSGSAALPAPLSEAWLRATGHRLLERYGMTEIGMALSNPYEGERRVGTVGRPLPGVEVRLATDGEILVRGPGVFREYWGKPQATDESFTADGWFQTGDIAETDPDGYFRILGRRSQDILKSGGYKISALEIEDALLGHPGVREVAVVAVPDAAWGERVAAVYVGEAESEALALWLRDRLASYKIPSLWSRATELPRNAMGKVLKANLRSLFPAVAPAPR